jgi:hypothetical protein
MVRDDVIAGLPRNLTLDKPHGPSGGAVSGL